ncbi:protein DpdE [Cupriavidus necator]|uniref:protein DpdE n=1 Tax=Cupriavidus necator TaxID=106590 RepID=UPI0005B3FC8E|nr:protein DpdE [Cupriavidus necator]
MVEVRLEVGAFVQTSQPPYAAWGVGKFLGAEAGRGRVQYFDAPGAEMPQVVECALTRIKPVALPEQTRVYRRHGSGRWQAGRVLDGDGNTLFVQFPNGEAINVDAADLQVRWNRPLRDPLPLLISEATETPFLADARSAFVRQTALQYAAASGITAALSANIELVDYQFEVMRRVLTDPVQRYLLADEVGLGKTIEAGVIIRQYFLDLPQSAKAIVLTPAALVPQWREELSTRFGLGDEFGDFLHVICSDDLTSLRETLPDTGMLVIDEAHHLSRLESESQRELYGLLQAHVQRIPRLLLLSATPVLSDPEGFLRVLHLLDPVNFPLDDLAGFQRRITTRQVVAEVVAALQPENLWGLQADLDRLKEAYGNDRILMEKVEALRVVIDTFPDEEDERYTAALADLKTHLVESYRLHRRLVRNRRAAVQWATPRRAGLKRVSFRSEGTERWHRRIEELRYCLVNLEALTDSLRSALLECAVNPRQQTGFLAQLEQFDVQDEEARGIAMALDASAARMREGQTRFDALAVLVRQTLEAPGAQVVVFCSQREDADRAAAHLQRLFDEQVVRHEVHIDFDDADDAHTPMPWRQFLAAPQNVRVLVCDARAEEGVNLHGGRKIAIHFDMPASPNRCEQRLGRLDRFGSGDPIVSHALLDEANPDEAAWIETLDTGWRVFDRSVASLQYLIESASQKLAEDWFAEGTQAIRDHLVWLAGPEGRVQQELRQIDQQDALDALSEPESAAFDDVSEQDEAWRDWQTAFNDFAIGLLGFQMRPEAQLPVIGEQAFRIGYVPPGNARGTLIPLRGYLRQFLQSVDLTAHGSTSQSPLTYRYVFRRQNALTPPARAQGVRVLRIGDPFVAALEQFATQDDRGRAFAMWRADRNYEVKDSSGADLHFRFDFVIRPALGMLGQDDDPTGTNTMARSALLRQSQAYFPPLFVRIWVDGMAAVIAEPAESLTAPYQRNWKDGRRDFNLNPKRWRELPAGVHSTWMRNWGTICNEARRHAEAAALRSAACQQHIARALNAVEQEFAMRRAQAESRFARLEGAQKQLAREDMSTDDALHAAIRDALARPSLELDVAGAVFLAAEGLSES